MNSNTLTRHAVAGRGYELHRGPEVEAPSALVLATKPWVPILIFRVYIETHLESGGDGTCFEPELPTCEMGLTLLALQGDEDS